jgi:hypothetical protein
MMQPEQFLAEILNPGIAWCKSVNGWRIPFDDRARVLLLAIAGQESNWSERIQAGKGPAHGFWQFERLGGVVSVLGHKAAAQLAHDACEAAGLSDPIKGRNYSTQAWGIMSTAAGDHLAVAFARLLLFSDPAPLPHVGDEEAGWDYYVRNWRPGKPSRSRWATVYPQAVAAIKSENQA